MEPAAQALDKLLSALPALAEHLGQPWAPPPRAERDLLACLDATVALAFALLDCRWSGEPLPERLVVPLGEVALDLLPASLAALISDEGTAEHGSIQLLMDTLRLTSRLGLVACSVAAAGQWSRALQQLRRALDLALPLVGDATAQLALLAPWLQTLDLLHKKCPAGVRPLLTPSVADPAFKYSLDAAALVWGGPWHGPPAEGATTAVQQIWIQAAKESAELLMLFAHWHRLETARGVRTPLAPRAKKECQRLLGFLMEELRTNGKDADWAQLSTTVAGIFWAGTALAVKAMALLLMDEPTTPGEQVGFWLPLMATAACTLHAIADDNAPGPSFPDAGGASQGPSMPCVSLGHATANPKTRVADRARGLLLCLSYGWRSLVKGYKKGSSPGAAGSGLPLAAPGRQAEALRLAASLLRLATKLPALCALIQSGGLEVTISCDTRSLVVPATAGDLVDSARLLLLCVEGAGLPQFDESGAAAAEALLPAAREVAVALIKLSRALAEGPLDPPGTPLSPADLAALSLTALRQAAWLLARFLAAVPRIEELKHNNLTEHLRETGLVSFGCTAASRELALHASGSRFLAGMGTPLWRLLEPLHMLGAVNEAVRAGLGGLLCETFKGCLRLLFNVLTEVPPMVACQGDGRLEVASSILIHCGASAQDVCARWKHQMEARARGKLTESLQKGAEGLAVGLCAQGLLRAAAEWSCQATSPLGSGRRQEGQAQALAVVDATGALLKSVAVALDEAAGTTFQASHPGLLAGAPDALAFMAPVRANPFETAGARTAGRRQYTVTCFAHFDLLPLSKRRGAPQFRRPEAWREVLRSLLPAMEAECGRLMGAATATPEQDTMFRDVAMGAWTCTNPGCTNLRGESEGEVPRKRCGACKEAAYCSRACQKQDWRRHEPICKAIRASKGGPGAA